MPAIKDRNSGEVIEIVDTREMGWCVGGWWLVTKDGYEVASYDVDFPQSPNRRENARYEALPAETQFKSVQPTCATCGDSGRGLPTLSDPDGAKNACRDCGSIG